MKPADFATEVHNDWCPGCGDFGILRTIQMALAELRMEPHRVTIVSGIGCSAKTIHYVKTYGVHTLHGRALPYATGVKLANPQLKVLCLSGDGDGLGIGGGHFVNAGRRNLDMLYVIHDNGVYGLTKGQAAPTLKLGDEGFEPVVHEPSELEKKATQALEKALEWGDRIPIGVFFKSEHVPTFEERIMQRVPTYMENPPALQTIAGPNGEPRTDLTRLIQRMTFKGA